LKEKEIILEVVENQLKSNDPQETKKTLTRLMADGISEENARIYIGQAICVEIWDTMRNKNEFNQDRYIKNLKRLPKEPQA